MLPKHYRLKKRSAFKATYKVKNSSHSGGVTLFAGIEKKEDVPTKVGFVVSKKVHKRAVRRNRLKRLMRESYRQLLLENNLYESDRFISELVYVVLTTLAASVPSVTVLSTTISSTLIYECSVSLSVFL